MKRLICVGIVVGLMIMALPLLPSFADDQDVLKQGLLGAATGAVAAGASGGKAGKGALIGAGTNVIGGALLNTITGPKQETVQQQPVYVQQQPVYAQPQPVYVQQQAPSAEQMWYQKGYQDGFKAGYSEGFNAHRR